MSTITATAPRSGLPGFLRHPATGKLLLLAVAAAVLVPLANARWASGSWPHALTVDLTEPLGLSQPTVSHHLKVLVEAGFLDGEKRGVWTWYSLVPDAVERAVAALPGLGRLARA